MATTTNYGWTTPNDTDLVKDGASAIRSLGQSIDTTFAELKGGTSGQMLTKASNTDLDLVWVTPQVGDITAVTAGTGISGGGTGGDVTITNSMATAIDAKGDLIAGTGADAFSRLAVGSNDQVLTADSTAATGMKWASPSSGSMTLLASGSFSSSALSLTSISGAYTNLVLIFENYYRSGGTDTNIRLNADSGSNYSWAQYATGLTSFNTSTNNTVIQTNQPGFNSAPGSLYLTIYNYANTNSHKAVTSLFNGNAGGSKNAVWNVATYASTTAITGISTLDAMTSGSYKLYGVK